MAGSKLSAKATETIEYLEALLKETDHFAALVEQYAAAKTKGSDAYATQLGRELGHLRQKAMMRNLGFIADTAGQLSVMASRGGSPMMKSRMLRDGVVAFRSLVERTIKGTMVADENEQKEKTYQAEKAKKAEAEHIKARVLAEEARDAARKTAAPGAGPGASPPVAGVAAGAPKPGAAAPAKPAPAAAPKPAPRPASTPGVAPKPPAGAVPRPAPGVAPKPGPAVAPKPGPAVAPKPGPAVAPKPGPASAPRPGPATAPQAGAAVPAPRPAAAPAPKPGPGSTGAAPSTPTTPRG